MASERDYGVRDFGQCTLALRRDLNWIPQLSSVQPFYLVEDPLNAKFLRVGTAEYAFISLLDGRTSVRQAVRQTAKALPDAAFSEQEAAVICRWLLDNGLVELGEGHAAERDHSAAQGTGAALHRWNPLTLRIPLVHPSTFFTSLTPWLHWAFTPLALLGWLVFVASGLLVVCSNWSRFAQSLDGVIAPLTWLLLPAAWLVLKLVHEAAHGVACRRFGADVREAGVILILLMPVTYVDVTSSWRIRSKWHRIITAAAGMYAELFLAAAAALLWSRLGPGLASNVCCAIVVMASVTTLAFNSNFLLKFDGYYILSDLLEIPNLSSLAQQELSHLLLRIVRRAGPAPAARPASAWKRWFVIGYGIASLAWKTLVCACLVITASTLFDGAGIVLAVAAAALWILVPARKLVVRLVQWRRERDSDSHVHGAAMLLIVGLCAALTAAPWPGANHTPVVVEYADLCVVRADSPGFVREMRVHGGQQVQVGQVLAVLQNDELEDELNGMRLSVLQSEIKVRAYEHDRQTAAWQAEVENLNSLRQRLQDKSSQVEKLTIRAASSGQVIGRDLDNLSGVFLEAGATLLSVGRERHKELRVAISQEEFLRFQKSITNDLRVKLPGSDAFFCRLAEVTPRASLWCPHEALAAANGGSLLVRATSSDEPAEAGLWELVTPHFVGRVELPEEQSVVLRAGQVGTAAIHVGDESIGRHLFQAVRRWTLQKWRTATARGEQADRHTTYRNSV